MLGGEIRPVDEQIDVGKQSIPSRALGVLESVQGIARKDHDGKSVVLGGLAETSEACGLGKGFASKQGDAFDPVGGKDFLDDVFYASECVGLKGEHVRIATSHAAKGAPLYPKGKALSRSFGFCLVDDGRDVEEMAFVDLSLEDGIVEGYLGVREDHRGSVGWVVCGWCIPTVGMISPFQRVRSKRANRCERTAPR